MSENKVKLSPKDIYKPFGEYSHGILNNKSGLLVTSGQLGINKYGTMHTDSIVTNNKRTAEFFLNQMNSAIAMHNASTLHASMHYAVMHACMNPYTNGYMRA